MQANEGQQRPMQANKGQQKPTTANDSQQRSTLANKGQKEIMTGARDALCLESQALYFDFIFFMFYCFSLYL